MTVELRSAPAAAAVDGRKLRGLVPYGVLSRPFADGSREVIDAGALDGADLSDLALLIEHDRSQLLARYPGTLQVELRAEGLAWEAVLGATPRAIEVRSSLERGDLTAGSWGMVVSRDRWEGSVRHVEKVAALVDLSVTVAPVYREAAVSYRSVPVSTENEVSMSDVAPEPVAEATAPVVPAPAELRSAPSAPAVPALAPAGTLRVEERSVERPRLGLAAEFRSAGFPGVRAEVPFAEFRAATFSGTLDPLSQPRVQGQPLGFDQRFAWTVLQQQPVGAGDTSVIVFRQSARTIPSAASMNRVITSTATKPEVASTIEAITLPLRQVPAVVSGMPNIYLEQPAFNSVIEGDLRLAMNVALDGLVATAIATGTGFQAPGTDPRYVSIRKAMTTMQNAGYRPDTVVLTPADAEALDVLVSGLSGGVNDYVNGAGQFAPGTIFGMRRVVTATVPASVVMDSTAFGKIYTSPVALARFEENAGTSNSSAVRMECNGVVGVERTAAAIRIAAS